MQGTIKKGPPLLKGGPQRLSENAQVRGRAAVASTSVANSAFAWAIDFIILVVAEARHFQKALIRRLMRHIDGTKKRPDLHSGRITAYFKPLLIVLTKVPWVSSPLNSQKNAPPSPWVFT